MTLTKPGTKTHPTSLELADYLDNRLDAKTRRALEEHIASCEECLTAVVSAYESVKESKSEKGKINIMKKLNIYLILAIISFALSFFLPQYFIQLLVATLILGIKWIVDAKSTRMLIMIYEAWKNGGEKEASRILNTLDPESKKRF